MSFVITGRVREKESLRPVPNLLVRAFDLDLTSTDLLGEATTNKHGGFRITYERSAFLGSEEECNPDIYLIVFGKSSDPSGNLVPIFTTQDFVRLNACELENFDILIPADRLGVAQPRLNPIIAPSDSKWAIELEMQIKKYPHRFKKPPVDYRPWIECTGALVSPWQFGGLRHLKVPLSFFL